MKRLFILFFISITAFQINAQEVSLREQAQQLADEGKYNDALNKINSLIIESPFVAEYHNFKATCLINLSQADKALTSMNFAIKMMPDTPYLYQTRGIILQAYGLYDQAIFDFTKIIELSENDKNFQAVALSNRGNCKSSKMDFDGALVDLKAAETILPNDLAVMSNIAKTLDEMGKEDEAIKYLDKILEIDTGYVSAIVNYGFIFQNRDEHEKALEYFNKAQKLAPMEPFIYSNRAFSKLKLNDLQNAWRDINTSIQLNRQNSYAYKIRALISLAKKDMKAVCIDLENALKLGYKEQYGDEVDKLKAEHCKE